MRRREFLKLAGAASAATVARGAMAQAGRGCAIVVDANDPVAGTPPVAWAAEQLRAALAQKGALCWIVKPGERAHVPAFYVVVHSGGVTLAGLTMPNPQLVATLRGGAEWFALSPGRYAGTAATIVSAGDVRGAVYGLLEMAERVRFATDARVGLRVPEPVLEKPANEVRSVGRYFCSEVEDKSWLYDREFWLGYLDLLAACRFNRFCLAFGLEYDFPRGVTSDYLHFPYPYLLTVPGYDVLVMQLTAAGGTVLPAPVEVSEREKKMNLDALKFIAAQTAARGLQFQLGIWTHAYQWTDSPHAYHRIQGLTKDTHAAYCRDALAMLLEQCPDITGLTMRVHGESGIPEGSYDFWKTLFTAIKDCGRTVEIDMHAKGVDETMIDIANATGMPVKLGAKYSAEHQSLGYQQADIRVLEIPKGNVEAAAGPFSLSSGSRSFTRYGYADFLKAGSKYKVLFRLWPGTQRHLLSADPEMAAAYGRTTHFCGAVGLDLMEPLTFKGREGSGHAGGRCAYADASLNPKADWEKFELYYRVWGRRLYDPDANPEAWRRWLRKQFGAGAVAMETAVANASRILPLLTSAHLPSASNHAFWPEIYTNMPVVRGSGPEPYSDTPEPREFGTVSPLDPQLFTTIDEHATDVMGGTMSPKVSPIEVAKWMEDLATAASAALDQARRVTIARRSPEFRRMEADVEIQAGLGWFFASKLRAGVLYSVFEQSQEAEAGRKAIDEYGMARDAWATMAAQATVYMKDVSYGSVPMRRGHWSDRLNAIDQDIAALTARVKSAGLADVSSENTRRATGEAMGRPGRPTLACAHKPPLTFDAGAPLMLTVTALVPDEVVSIRLHYRHVDQAERWKRIEMQGDAGTFTAAIPAAYTKSEFPLEYYFDLAGKSGATRMEPGFNETLSNQPYFALMRRG